MRVIGWPFPVSVNGDVTGGGPCTIVVEWRLEPGLQQETVDRVRCVVTWWARLAAEGGLGGERIPPDKGRGDLVDGEQPEVFPNSMRWSLTALSIDPFALTILFNLVLQSELPVVGISIACQGSELQINVTPRDYPGRWPQQPFVLDEDRTDRNIQLELELPSELVEPARSALVETLQVWSLVGGLGGFREMVPISEASEIVPEDDVGIDIDLVQFSFRDNNVNEVAYDVLVNLLVRTAVSVVPIARVELH